MKLQDESDEGDVDYVASAGMQHVSLMRLYYLVLRVSMAACARRNARLQYKSGTTRRNLTGGSDRC